MLCSARKRVKVPVVITTKQSKAQQKSISLRAVNQHIQFLRKLKRPRIKKSRQEARKGKPDNHPAISEFTTFKFYFNNHS